MLNSWQESQVLQGAIRRGWISEPEAVHAPAPPEGTGETTAYRYGPKLDYLLQAGRLQEAAIVELVRDVRSLDETCDPRGNDSPEPPPPAEFEEPKNVVAVNVRLVPSLDGGHIAVEHSGKFQPLSATSLSPALAQWERYEIQALLGRGGNGVVYKALDKRLTRTVALKFIPNSGVQTVQRLMREARAQARIDHSGVCKVYEVGEFADQLYIAMEYLPGRSLQDAQHSMTLEEKVYVIKDVAVALHAAHQLGIIHRDIKPANVMVSRKDDGGWKAVLMDFGLASDASDSARLTKSGAVMGTPVYMAPEQASGELSRLDRRTDVYSLGAMLYELLVGEPPFDGETMVRILLAVMHEEPVSLRRRNATVPEDLETITMKCLNKEMQRRYESAQALAEDLRRFLAGESIVARQTSRLYRLRQEVRKHKFMLALVTLALLGTGLSVGIWVHGRIEVGRQARLSQSFGQRIEIEMFLRYAYALPLHDTRIEKRVIRNRMQSIQEGLSRMDGEAAAMAHYALGRGHFALKEYDDALAHLEAAHRGGLKTAEVEYALGRTLGEIYNTHFKDLQRRSGQRLLAEKEKIDKLYLQPALSHLRQPSGLGGESKAFAEGLLAYYSQRYEEALHKADEALEKEPWLYEPKKLQGDVYYAYGFAKQKRGLYDEARADYRRAAALYHVAGEAARSDSATHGAEADVWVQVMEVDKSQGISPKEALDRALAACDRAMAADPENASALRKKVWAFIRWAEFQTTHGEDPHPVAQQAINAAQQAVRLNPRNAFPYDQMGNAYLLIARSEHDRGLDTSESERQAAAAFQKSIDANPMFAWAWNDFAVLHTTKADWLAARGGDYRSELSASISKLQRAIEADPDYHVAYSNLIDVYELLARYELDRGRSPESWIEKAVETSQRSLQVNPNSYQTYRNLASIYALRAEFETSSGRSPVASINKALEHLAQAIRANSDDAETHRVEAKVRWLAARDLLQQKRDAQEPLGQGLQAIRKSIDISANSTDSYLLQVQLLILAAQSAAQHGSSPLPMLSQAHKAAVRARTLNAKSPLVYLSLGTIALTAADWQLAHHQPAERDLAEGLAALEQTLNLNPTLAPALAIKGVLLLRRALTRPASAGRAQLEKQAQSYFAQALERNALLRRELDLRMAPAQPLSVAKSPAPAGAH